MNKADDDNVMLASTPWRVLASKTVGALRCVISLHPGRQDIRAVVEQQEKRVVALAQYGVGRRVTPHEIVEITPRQALTRVIELIVPRARTADMSRDLLVQAVSQAHADAVDALEHEPIEEPPDPVVSAVCRNIRQNDMAWPWGEKHPMQPVYYDKDRVLRFRRNNILYWLEKEGAIDLNTISRSSFRKSADVSFEDEMQLAQLLGYSLSGYLDLSYVTEEHRLLVERVVAEANAAGGTTDD